MSKLNCLTGLATRQNTGCLLSLHKSYSSNPCHTWLIPRRGLKSRHDSRPNVKIETRLEPLEGWDTVWARNMKQTRYQKTWDTDYMRQGILVHETRNTWDTGIHKTWEYIRRGVHETRNTWFYEYIRNGNILDVRIHQTRSKWNKEYMRHGNTWDAGIHERQNKWDAEYMRCRIHKTRDKARMHSFHK